MIARRAFLTGLIAAPAIVRIDALMHLRGTKLILPLQSTPWKYVEVPIGWKVPLYWFAVDDSWVWVDDQSAPPSRVKVRA